RRPAAAANQDATAVDAKEPPAPGRGIGRDLANAERDARTIGHALARGEFEIEMGERRRAQLRRPPEPRVRDMKLREAVRCESRERAVVRLQSHRFAEGDAPDVAAQRAGDRM